MESFRRSGDVETRDRNERRAVDPDHTNNCGTAVNGDVAAQTQAATALERGPEAGRQDGHHGQGPEAGRQDGHDGRGPEAGAGRQDGLHKAGGIGHQGRCPSRPSAESTRRCWACSTSPSKVSVYFL